MKNHHFPMVFLWFILGMVIGWSSTVFPRSQAWPLPWAWHRGLAASVPLGSLASLKATTGWEDGDVTGGRTGSSGKPWEDQGKTMGKP